MSAITAKARRKMKKYAVLTREPRCFLGSFDFSWEQRKLGDIASDMVAGGDIDKDLILAEGQYPVIANALTGDGIVGYYDKEYRVNAPAVTVTGRGDVGHAKARLVNFTPVVRLLSVKSEHDVFFLENAINTLKIVIESTGVPQLTVPQLAKYEVAFPRQLDEEEHIGAFFKQLDNLITLHQRKCALLFSPFQALISLIFTTSTFSWEQRKFGEITSKYEDPVPTPHDGYYRLGIRSHAKGTFHSYVSKGQELETAQMHRVAAGNFIVNITFGWEHAVAITDKNDAGKLVSHRFPQFSFAEGMVPEFFRYVIVDEKFRHHLWLASPGGAGRNRVLKLDEMLNYLMRFPSRDEQIKIAEFFRQLDNLITLHQRKCISFTGRAGRLISTVNKNRITSSWEQRKFDEVFDCTVPNNTLSRAELSYDEGTVLNVHYGDVLIKYGSVLDVQKDDIPRIPHRCRADFNGALLQDGDVIIADTAEDETTGKACEIGNLQGSAIVSGLHTMVCRPRNRMALGYLGYYLNSNAYHHQLLPLMQGIKVLSLSRSNIQKTSVSYPIAVKEQQLIAYYFSQLDNLITLHQRKPFLMKWRTSDANRNQTNRLVL